VNDSEGDTRRARLAAARLYLITDAHSGQLSTESLLRAALIGGVDIVQLRDKSADDQTLRRAGGLFRRLCDEHGALFIVNDRPDVAVACAADGVHLGQADGDLAAARRTVGDELLIGLSTHSPEQVDAGRASPADYLGVGPVWETTTKPGRAAVGLELVDYAARGAGKPFFAIGGIDSGRASLVLAAGADRLAVVRAIRDAPDPGRAANQLRTAIETEADARALA